MKIKESQLKNMIAKAINEAVDESRFDYLGSGMDAYQGTGSKESDERVKKIRSKWPKYHDTESGPTIEAPAGKYDKNKTTYDNAKQSYGGLDAKDSYEVFKEFIKPVDEKWWELHQRGNEEAAQRLYNLRSRFHSAYMDWAKEYKGAAEEEE